EVGNAAPGAAAARPAGPPLDAAECPGRSGHGRAVGDVTVVDRAPVRRVGDPLLVRPRSPLVPHVVGPTDRSGGWKDVSLDERRETNRRLRRDIGLHRRLGSRQRRGAEHGIPVDRLRRGSAGYGRGGADERGRLVGWERRRALGHRSGGRRRAERHGQCREGCKERCTSYGHRGPPSSWADAREVTLALSNLTIKMALSGASRSAVPVLDKCSLCERLGTLPSMPGFEDGFLGVPARPGKPRSSGLTHVIDKGLNLREIEGLFDTAGAFVDIVKLGWGTGYVTNNLEKKIALYRHFETPVVCGGTFFEAVYARDKVEELKSWLTEYRFSHVEISDGLIDI